MSLSTPHHVPLAALADQVGREVALSAWQTIDQALIDQFATLTGDTQWIHVDAARASASPFGTTVAHGLLTLSLIPAMRMQALHIDGVASAINYGMNRVRFVAPVKVGSDVRGRFQLQGADTQADGKVLLTWAVTVEVRGQERPACVAELLSLVVPERSGTP